LNDQSSGAPQNLSHIKVDNLPYGQTYVSGHNPENQGHQTIMPNNKTSITAVIVDDEYWARENLFDLLSDYEQVKIIGQAASVSEARERINTLKPDAVFLDIQLKEGTGFDVLSGLDFIPRVVFVTAFDHFALRAFEINALDYLLKPIEPERLKESVQRLLAGTNNTSAMVGPSPSGALTPDDQILLGLENSLVLVRVDSIVWIRAARNNTELVCAGQRATLKSRHCLKLWEERLKTLSFLRIDRSTIINTSRVTNLHSEPANPRVEFRDTNKSLPLGRTAAENLKKHLLRAYSLQT